MVSAGVGITYLDVKCGRVGWADVWKVDDMLRLREHLDWACHEAAEAQRR